MSIDKKTPGYWTYEKCKEEALKYNYRSDFKKGSSGAYNASLRNKWIGEITSHMDCKIHPNGYWTKERCHEEALKYKFKAEFKKNSGSAYVASRINKWLNDICSHMQVQGNRFNRCIYAYEFPDNSAYIGLTYNIQNREYDHFSQNKSAVYKHIKLTGLQPEFKQLTDFIDKELASIKEGEYENEYKQNGWNILNRSKTGGVGGNVLKWTYKKCKEEALKYTSRTDFQKRAKGSYKAAVKNNWMDDICSHMISIQKPAGYWTKELCHQEALKYKSKYEFQKNNGSAYHKALKSGWLNDICPHMISIQKPAGYWTYDRCKEEALKYNSRTEFQNGSSSAYNLSVKNKWIDYICFHMPVIKNIKGYWTKERCHEEALKYRTRTDFSNNSSAAYCYSLKKKWLDDICSHMNTIITKTRNYWTYDRCKEEALKYNKKDNFKKNVSGAYCSSLKNKWLDEFFPKKII